MSLEMFGKPLLLTQCSISFFSFYVHHRMRFSKWKFLPFVQGSSLLVQLCFCKLSLNLKGSPNISWSTKIHSLRQLIDILLLKKCLNVSDLHQQPANLHDLSNITRKRRFKFDKSPLSDLLRISLIIRLWLTSLDSFAWGIIGFLALAAIWRKASACRKTSLPLSILRPRFISRTMNSLKQLSFHRFTVDGRRTKTQSYNPKNFLAKDRWLTLNQLKYLHFN